MNNVYAFVTWKFLWLKDQEEIDANNVRVRVLNKNLYSFFFF